MVIATFAVAAGWFAWQRLEYSHVPWTQYSPPDNTFKVKFAGTPEVKHSEKNINGEIWPMTILSSNYKGHYYDVQYCDVHRVITTSNAPRVLEEYFEGFTRSLQSTVVKEEQTTIGGNPAIRYTLEIPPTQRGDGVSIAHGILAIRDKRVFFVHAISPRGHKSMSDLQSFLDSFELAPPPAASSFAI